MSGEKVDGRKVFEEVYTLMREHGVTQEVFVLLEKQDMEHLSFDPAIPHTLSVPHIPGIQVRVAERGETIRQLRKHFARQLAEQMAKELVGGLKVVVIGGNTEDKKEESK